MRRFLALLLSLLLLASSSYGWFGLGHMAVAYIAYQHLDPAVKTRVDTLISKNPSYQTWKKGLPAGLSASDQKMMLFMIAATWPDQIRSDGIHKPDGPEGGNRPPAKGGDVNVGYSDLAMHKYWHFVDDPISQDGTHVPPTPSPNAESEIHVLSAALANSKNPKLQSYDLVWLMHLVGDVHQPLHSVARFSADLPNGDNGGNSVNLNPPPCQDDTSAKELHALWDGALGDSSDPKAVIPVATALPPQTVDAGDLDVHGWVNESYQLAQTKVYVSPIGAGKGPFTIDQAYCDQMRAVAAQRVVQAGMRLANILNADLK